MDELGASATVEAACCSLGSGDSMSFVGLLLSVMSSCRFRKGSTRWERYGIMAELPQESRNSFHGLGWGMVMARGKMCCLCFFRSLCTGRTFVAKAFSFSLSASFKMWHISKSGHRDKERKDSPACRHAFAHAFACQLAFPI